MPRFLWNLYALCYDAIAGLAPYQDMLDRVVEALDLAPGMRVLDAGCGTGALADKIAHACPGVELVGLDLSPTMLKRATRRQPWPPGFDFVEGDIDDFLASRAGRFDRIASVNVIWTLTDPQRTFTRMAQALRPGGRMVHTTPRLRFRAERVVWDHLRRQKGRARLRALAGLPMLGLAGLINLALVVNSLCRRSARDVRKRWSSAGLQALMDKSGVAVTTVDACYAGQAHLLVCTQGPAPSRLPVLPKGL